MTIFPPTHMSGEPKFLGHPVHQMVVVFPLGLLGTSFLFDVAHKTMGGRDWSVASQKMLGAGVMSGLGAAVFGLIDWLAIPAGTRAKRIGLLHGVGNVFAMGLFGASLLLRRKAHAGTAPFLLSGAGFCLSMGTAWLGGELVDRLSVGVDDGANLNAPNSLFHKHANTHARPAETRV